MGAAGGERLQSENEKHTKKYADKAETQPNQFVHTHTHTHSWHKAPKSNMLFWMLFENPKGIWETQTKLGLGGWVTHIRCWVYSRTRILGKWHIRSLVLIIALRKCDQRERCCCWRGVGQKLYCLTTNADSNVYEIFLNGLPRIQDRTIIAK